jgi:hypothetical protein
MHELHYSRQYVRDAHQHAYALVAKCSYVAFVATACVIAVSIEHFGRSLLRH